MTFNKGDIVKFNKTVKCVPVYYQTGTQKELVKYTSGYQLTGVVLGYSFLKTGNLIKHSNYHHYEDYYYEPSYLQVDKTHKVLVIEPFEQNNTWLNDKPIFKTNRYLEPVRCFESDVKLIGE